MIETSQYPKGKKLLEEFARRNLAEFQKNIMKDAPVEGLEIPAITDEMAEQYAKALLTTQPRILYDFFDENGIIIEITFSDKEGGWDYNVNNTRSLNYASRLQAENNAFYESFRQLEEKI